MSREIKFRAWEKSYEDSEGEMLIMPMNKLKFDYEQGFVLAFTEYEDFYCHEGYGKERIYTFEVMQYTGLKDKNGKEIYEGDIRKDGHYVKYWGEKACFGWYKTPFGFIITTDFAEEEIEVTGNIYENPELITNKQK